MSKKFSYVAVKTDNSQVEGTREATDRFVLARALRAEGLTVIKVEEIKEGRKNGFSFGDIFGRVKTKDKIVFAGALSSMIGAGLSLSRAMEVIERQTSNKKFKAVVTSLIAKVNAGNSFSQALEAYPNIFPPVFIAMVAAGEESGNLSQSIDIVRQQMAKSYDLGRKVRGAMIYPVVILCVIIAIAILMMMFVVPTITAVFKEFEAKLPLSTRFIIAISDFVSGSPFLFIGLLVAAILALIYGFKTATGKKALAYVAIHLPAISQIVKNFNAAVTMRTISSLVSSGVSMIQAITITARVVQNNYYRLVLTDAAGSVQKGSPLSAAFKAREDIYPILVGEMTEVGEETGNLSGMMLKGAEFFEEEVEQATKNLSTIIEPALMILIGLAVGFFAVSIIGPIYSLGNAM